MTDIAEQNLQLLCQRWPDLAARITAAEPPQNVQWAEPARHPALEVDGHRLWSAYDAEAEARLQAQQIPPGSREAWVYGVGGGDLIRELLKRDEIERLHVVVLNVGVVHLLLHLLDQRDWLGNERVALLDGARQEKPGFPFTVVPPCLTLCTADGSRLREQLTDELLRPFEQVRREFATPRRRQQIVDNAELVAADGDVAELFDTASGATAYVAIAGPTLNKTAAWLLDHRDSGSLVCVDGALRPLLDIGLVPDIVVCVDEYLHTVLPYFAGDLSACRNSILVYAPLVHHEVLTLWPGRRLAAYTFESIYDDLRASVPKAKLHVAGSVAHPAVDVAIRMGVRRIILFGADFGFPGGLVHANSKAPVAAYREAAKAGATTKDGHGRQIPTLHSFNSQRLGLEEMIAYHKAVTFINASRDGARIEGTQHLEDAI